MAESEENLIKWLYNYLVEVNWQLALEFCNYSLDSSKEEVLEEAAKVLTPEEFNILKVIVE